MSDFSIPAHERQRLLSAETPAELLAPLVFDTKPHGCEPGAKYVLAWRRGWFTVYTDRDARVHVDRIPKLPSWYLTVKTVKRVQQAVPHGAPKWVWVVRFDVTDRRDPDLYLRPSAGVQLGPRGAVDELPMIVDDETRQAAISELHHLERLARSKAARRARDRARRAKRRAA